MREVTRAEFIDFLEAGEITPQNVIVLPDRVVGYRRVSGGTDPDHETKEWVWTAYP